jgi:hypothetical protein
MAKKPIRKGSTKTFPEPNPHRVPSDRPMKVLAYDDDIVVVQWDTENHGKPVIRTASIPRKDWDSA